MFFHRVDGSSNDKVSNSHQEGEHIGTLQISQNSLLCSLCSFVLIYSCKIDLNDTKLSFIFVLLSYLSMSLVFFIVVLNRISANQLKVYSDHENVQAGSLHFNSGCHHMLIGCSGVMHIIFGFYVSVTYHTEY